MLHTENAQWPLAEILRKTVLRLVEITTTTFTPRLPVTEEAVLTRITGAHEDYLRSKCACDNGHSFTAVQCYFRPCWTYGLCSEWGRSTLERENFCRESSHHAQNVLIALSGWGLSGGRSPLNIRMTLSPLACSLQSGGLDVSAGILVVCCSRPAPSSYFCHVWGKCLELRSCWTHSKSIHMLTEPSD